jgi:hypothetical protein
MNIISFSLWGNTLKYTIGAIENAKLAKSIYPGWLCYYFIDSKVPQDIIDELLSFDNVVVTIIEDDNTINSYNNPINYNTQLNHNNHTAAFWRFMSLETDADIILIRDTDSRLSIREKILVDEFIISDKNIHIIKDHPGHLDTKIMAGMWGVKKDTISNIRERIDVFLNSKQQYGIQYGADQKFLELIYDEYNNQILEHDPFNDDVFKAPRVGFEFIGQVYDEHNNPHLEYARELEELIINNKCFRNCNKIKYIR